MLVLTRKSQQSLLIGKDVTIKILRSRTGEVRLGIEAPSDVRILRGELIERLLSEEVKEEQQESLERLAS